MPSTYSNLKIQLMATGENNTAWGDVTNINLGTALEEAVVGSADVAFSNADVTLTLTNTNATQPARNLRLNLTGTATTGYNLILGSGCQIDKPYIVNNATDGTITVKNTTGTGVAIAAGLGKWVYNDGVNVVEVTSPATYPQNIQSGNYTLAIVDAGRHIYSNNTAVQTITIPTNASVAFPLGTTITIVNRGTSQILLGVSGVSVIANGSASAITYPTLAVNNSVQLLKTGTNTWQSTFGTVAATVFSYLNVAGGGGGGKPGAGGGGGAGGLVTGTSTFATGTLTVSVGAGGTAGVFGGAASTAGTNSSITGTTAAVGGGSGGEGSVGGTGGSGGGGSYDGSSGYAGGAATSGQGFAGGSSAASAYTGGGGGGAGAVGANANGTTNAGAGGAGLASSITGSSVTYAGGGGGGNIYNTTVAAGGTGGGGAGGSTAGNAVAGTANTGGGGGGGGPNNGPLRTAAAGGSGVVVISSPIAAASTTGSPTITTSGGNTIYVFNSSGTITF
jgi:hypothetical protein